MAKIITNTRNLDVASNEYATKWSAQRIFNRLLENDQKLEAFYNSIFGNASIFQYSPDVEYKYGDVVWFVDQNSELHILRFDKSSTSSLETAFQNLNRWDPNGHFFLSRYGWKDLNVEVDILKDFGLDKAIATYVARWMKQHSEDPNMHLFGRLSLQSSSANFVENKIARRDLANVNPDREDIFFPYHTLYLDPDPEDAILAGQCRWYDNGLLEYDLVFRLSYFGQTEVDPEYSEYADALSANVLNLTQNNIDGKYFSSYSDQSIFMPMNAKTSQSQIGYTVQRNRNDFVNVYSAKIDFAKMIKKNPDALPIQFMTTDGTPEYMIFSSDIMCQDRDCSNPSLNPSSNSICFCQKTAESFCAFLVTYGAISRSGKNKSNATSGGLQANSFHCKLVGRHL